MAESKPELSPIQKIKAGLLRDVITPIGRHATAGVRGNLSSAREEATDANKLAREFEQRFDSVSRLVAMIATRSTASMEDLQAANPAQETALGIAATVLNGTRNSHARDALQTMQTISKDTPPLVTDMATLSEQSADLQGRLQGLSSTIEDTVRQTTTDVETTFEPPLSLAPKVIQLTRKYANGL